ncbi:peptidylprolyl isomerase [Acidipila sp. EB88]|nr:peptidylprolyl isomerase [Acidipila sp. EB88]
MRVHGTTAVLLAGLALACLAPAVPAQTTTAQTSKTPSATSVHHPRAKTTAARPAAKPCPPALPDPVTPAGLAPATGPVQTAFALRYVDTTIGTGALVVAGEPLTVHYTGWLASDGTKFDSSLDRGTPITFQQGAHRVIPGWDQGFTGMRVGGKRRLFIPYQLAYGDMGHPPAIPEKSDLIFDIELVAAGDSPEPPQPPAPATPPNPAGSPNR